MDAPLNDTRILLPYWSRFSLSIVFGFLITISFFGNLLVCAAVYGYGKLHKRENFYFVSLSVADLMLSCLVMPFGAITVIKSEWFFGAYCKYWMCTDIMCCTASILHLAAISFDRYTQIKDPLRYRDRMSIRKILIILSIVWTISGVVAFLPLAFETNFHRALVLYREIDGDQIDRDQIDPNRIDQNHTRFVYQCRFNLDPLYAVLSSSFSFYIPCALMTGAYGKLYKFALKHSLADRKQKEEVCIPLLIKMAPPLKRQSSAANSCTSLISTPEPSRRRFTQKGRSIRRRIEGDYKARITVGVIVGALLISWLPFFVANIVQAYCNDDYETENSNHCLPEWLFITIIWMGYANSAQNPIIYSIFNRDFRLAFRRILMCGKVKRRSSSVAFSLPDQEELAKRRMTVCDM